MIAPGTLCYLLGSHIRAGQTCTVTGPLRWRQCWLERSHFDEIEVYPIELSSREPATPFSGWAARPRDLVPITPPPGTIDEPERETAGA